MEAQRAIHQPKLLASPPPSGTNQPTGPGPEWGGGRWSFLHLEGSSFMLGENRLSDGKRKTLSASSGCWDETREDTPTSDLRD